jgi:hypothetical protein
MKSFTYASLCLAALFLFSCSSQETTQPDPTPSTSFERLQQKVLTPSCATAGCHVAGSQFATESGLVLSADVAFANLVGVAAKQTNAAADGLLRVKPGFPDLSFLYMKVHGFPEGKDYGTRMPLGGKRLTIGQMEFIKQWIATGALKTGDDIDPKLLDDTTQVPLETFTPLDPPAPGTGYQLKLDQFPVASNFERELFVYRKLGNTEPIFVNRIQTKMRTGSHHFVFYRFMDGTPKSVMPSYDVVRDIRFPNGTINYETVGPMEYHVYAGGTQMGGDVDYRFPPGVALALPADMSLDCNAHYVNHTGKPSTGECYANLYTMPAAEVEHEAQPLNLPNFDLDIPAGERRTMRKAFANLETKPMSVIMLTSHTHQWMERFIIRVQGGPRNGEIVYETTDWAHPGVKYYDPPIVINPGEALVSEVTYHNTTNNPIEFGLQSTDEMDIIFGYYYY